MFNLSDDELTALKASHFLLSKEVNELILILPQLIRNLSHSTQREKVEYKGTIRGRVDWNQTIKERYSQGYNDPSLFICTSPLKSYDLDENRLFKFILEKIIYLFEKPLQFINTNEDLLNKYENLESKNNENNENNQNSWQYIINEIYFKSKKTLKNIYFDNISSINYIKPETYRKTRTNRNRHYKKVASAYKLYHNLFINEDLETLKDLLDKQLLKPNSDDALYELYIFFKLVNTLDKNNIKLGILAPGHDYAVKYTDNSGKIIKIYYQNVPSIFNQNTEYKEIFKNYDINVNLRRPDILIEITEDNKTSYRIVEVKRTNSSEYIRDSVYKVLGYLRDFKDVPFREDIPGIIITWGGVEIINNNAYNQKVLILNRNEFLNNLDKILEIDNK